MNDGSLHKVIDTHVARQDLTPEAQWFVVFVSHAWSCGVVMIA